MPKNTVNEAVAEAIRRRSAGQQPLTLRKPDELPQQMQAPTQRLHPVHPDDPPVPSGGLIKKGAAVAAAAGAGAALLYDPATQPLQWTVELMAGLEGGLAVRQVHSPFLNMRGTAPLDSILRHMDEANSADDADVLLLTACAVEFRRQDRTRQGLTALLHSAAGTPYVLGRAAASGKAPLEALLDILLAHAHRTGLIFPGHLADMADVANPWDTAFRDWLLGGDFDARPVWSTMGVDAASDIGMRAFWDAMPKYALGVASAAWSIVILDYAKAYTPGPEGLLFAAPAGIDVQATSLYGREEAIKAMNTYRDERIKPSVKSLESIMGSNTEYVPTLGTEQFVPLVVADSEQGNTHAVVRPATIVGADGLVQDHWSPPTAAPLLVTPKNAPDGAAVYVHRKVAGRPA